MAHVAKQCRIGGMREVAAGVALAHAQTNHLILNTQRALRVRVILMS